MKVVRVLVLVVLAGGFAASPGGAACTAAAAGTAGVVIESETTREFCVPVEGDEMSALDALRATGVEVVIEDFGADAITVCRIDDVGCDHPTEPCFCACADPSRGCTFWGIYTLTNDDGWSFAQQGIGEVRVRAGDVLGLRWTEQTEDGSAPPTGPDPAGVCTRVRPVATAADDAARDIPWGLVILATVVTVVVLSALRSAGRRREGDA